MLQSHFVFRGSPFRRNGRTRSIPSRLLPTQNLRVWRKLPLDSFADGLKKRAAKNLASHVEESLCESLVKVRRPPAWAFVLIWVFLLFQILRLLPRIGNALDGGPPLFTVSRSSHALQ